MQTPPTFVEIIMEIEVSHANRKEELAIRKFLKIENIEVLELSQEKNCGFVAFPLRLQSVAYLPTY